MPWRNNESKSFRFGRKSQVSLAVVSAVLLGSLGAVLWWFVDSQVKRDSTTDQVVEMNQIVEPTNEAIDEASEEPDFDAEQLQIVATEWAEEQAGDVSIVMMASDGETIASVRPQEEYFAASLYKLYVAYVGYLGIDNGEYDGNEMYLAGDTRLECLDRMIRESYSPCAEKMWNELGKENITSMLQEWGIDRTSMTDITTTAEDASKILARLVTGAELGGASQAAYLDSMLDQPALYRRGLPSGFSEVVAVHNKVGWNELVEWHDAAILQLEDGREIIVSVLTRNVGSRAIAEFGSQLEAVLVQ